MNAMRLADKVVLVTGGSRGLGATMADALEAAGARVLVADIRLEPEQAGASPGRRAYVEADISTPEGAQGTVEACLETFGRIDAVVNNAGILMREARKRTGIAGHINFWDVDADTVRRFLDVHVVGSFLVSRAAVPHLLAQRSGRIITVSTSFSTMLDGGRTPYGPAKAGMEAFASVMAHDLEGTGVTVNVLIPGHPHGQRGTSDRGAFAARGPDGKRVVPRVPATVMGPPVVWLVSDDSADTHGRRLIGAEWQADIDAGGDERTALAAAEAPIAWAVLDSDRRLTELPLQ